MFEKNGQKIVQPDDKEVVITRAEHRIMLAVQKDAAERWRSRMDNTVETLRTDLNRLSAKMAEEVVFV